MKKKIPTFAQIRGLISRIERNDVLNLDILKEISAVLFNLAKVKTEHVYLTNRI